MYKKIKNFFTNQKEQKQPSQNSVLLRKPHFIFSAEQAYHPAKMQMSTEDVLKQLQSQGLNASTMAGKYGGDETSIIVHDVPEEWVPKLNQMAADLGQDSSIYSTGNEHKMFYHHGENAGSYVRGEGTEFHKQPPADYFSQMKDGTLFTHNFDFDTFHRNDTKPIKKSEDDGKYLEHYSPKQGLTTIDPAFTGQGVDNRQRAATNRQSKFSFYYPADYEKPEQFVTNQAQSKYKVRVPDPSKVFDSEVHGSEIINQVKDKNMGAFNVDDFVSALKEAGYQGFKSRPQGVEMVAMFDKLPVAEETPVKPFKFQKSEDLVKGSLQRKHRFNPRTDQGDKDYLGQWQVYGAPNMRDELPTMPEQARFRGAHKLHSKTESRLNPQTGEREFLLHRGVGPEEYEQHASDGDRGLIGRKLSWTPKHAVANSFAIEYADEAENPDYSPTVVSAWIPESQIVTIPNQLEVDDTDDYTYEHEVIANTPERGFERMFDYQPSSSTKPKNVNQSINVRGRSDLPKDFKDRATATYRSKFKKSESDIKKMSRPMITFPKLGLDTRPDQQVQTIETPRQKKMYGRSVANASAPDETYQRKSPYFGEELLTHARDLLVNPVKRKAFKKQFGEDVANPVIQKLKQGHQRAYELAQQIDEDAFGKSELQKDESSLFGGAAAPKSVSPQYSENIRNLASQYAQSKGFDYQPMQRQYNVNEDRAKKIAAAYQGMKHDPDNPEVKEAYDSLVNETIDQWNAIQQTGLKVTPIQPGQENPYKSSKDVHKDIRENNHLYYFPTDQGFGSQDQGGLNHPMLRQTDIEIGGKPAAANDIFRIVHDYFGHAKEGSGFGPKGEENAWHAHRRMYSPAAQKALTTETRGQNSWVNFGPHGEANRANPANTIYADQKAGLLPDWAMEYDEEAPESTPQVAQPNPVKKSENDLQKMGVRGDWKKEGYTIDVDDMDDLDLWIRARDSKGKPVGHAQIGHASIDYKKDGQPKPQESPDPVWTSVDPEHQRKGLATAMYQMAEEKLGRKLQPSLFQSPDAEKLWNQPKRPFGKSEIEKNMKGLRAGILGAVAAGNIASAKPASQDFQQQDVSQNTTAQVEQPNYQTVPDQKINHDQHQQNDLNLEQALNAISQVESSGGKNLNHRTIASGMHAGMHSRSAYGLMPIVIKETIKANKDLAQSHGHLLNLEGDEFHTAYHKNPELDREVARKHLNRIKNHFGNDIDKIAMAWLNGITGTKRAINQGKNIKDHWHVQKVRNAYQDILNKRKSQ